MNSTPQQATLGSSEPMQVARHLLRTRFSTPNNRNGLWYWRGNFYEWYADEWCLRNIQWMESALWISLENLTFQTTSNGVVTQQRYGPNITKVQGVLRALQAIQTMPHEQVPVWLGGENGPSCRHSISFKDVVVDCSTKKVLKRTEAWFDPHVLPVDYNPKAQSPLWDRCLEEWSGGDKAWIGLLQRMFGYCLMPHREYAKWFLLYGKIRGGKGTIMGVLKSLLRDGYMATCLEDIAGQFGLWGIEHSRILAINEVSEISSREGESACRVIKSIVGRDPISINRKYEAPMRNVVVDAIPIMQSNEIPRLPNKGKGLSSKMVLLPFNVSFAGREDYGLLTKLLEELPGIAKWAIEGAHLLENESNPRKKFVMPQASNEMVEEYQTVNNPFDEFLGDRFSKNDRGFVSTSVVYANWIEWSKGLRVPSLSQGQLVHRLLQDSTWNIRRDRMSGGGRRGLRGLSVGERL